MRKKLLLLLAVMTLLFSTVACKKEEEEPEIVDQVFETSFCILELTSEFQETTIEGFDYSLKTDKISVLCSFATREQLTAMGYPEEYDLDDFTKDIIGEDQVISQMTHDNFNEFDYFSRDTEGNEEYYFLVGLYGGSEKFLIVNFVVDAKDKDDYETRLRDWAGKVKVK